jgi:hypothetical protein
MIENAKWCVTCGNNVSPEDMCNCWTLLADALQRYLGMDFDASADLAARMWREEADKEYVWSAEYANDHDVETYPEPGTHQLTDDDRTLAIDAAENACNEAGNAGDGKVAAYDALHTKLTARKPLTVDDLRALSDALVLSIATCDPRCNDDMPPMQDLADRVARVIEAAA